MERYDSYKDSGVEWIGEIPSHWECMRLGMLGRFSSSGIDKKSKDGEEQVKMVNYTDLVSRGTYNPVQTEGQTFMQVTTPKSKLEEHRLNRGDLVMIPSSETHEDLGYSSLIDFQSTNTVFSYHILRLQFKRNLSHYFKKYLINHHAVLSHFSSEGKGTTRQIIGRYVVNGARVVLPPLHEQEQIVEYLDRKTTLIDSLIEKTVRKIELLKEKRTSLINEVVTKGLNPDVEMKDSGVEWIGEIPSHWGVTKLGLYTTKIGSGSTPRGGTEVYVDSGIPFIRSQNVHFEGLKLMEVSFIDIETHYSMKGSVVRKEDVLLNITGGSIGRCCVVDVEEEMNVNQHVSIIRTKSQLLNRFLNFLISCDVGQSQVRFNLTGGNREGLTIEGIRNFQITLPPFHEQEQIVEYLDEQTSIIDSTITTEEKRIELLKEYRQSLISEVVTGKVKVTRDE